VPIHLHAEHGDYAETCLVPGDPVRARVLAERFLDAPREVNANRGLLGFTGTFRGVPVSIQATGMGCPSAAIVAEELVALGVRRLIRVGTCGALQHDLELGDLVLGLAATPSDRTALAYTAGEPHAPTASWPLVERIVAAARQAQAPLRVGPIVSCETFYDPDPDRNHRWCARGHLAVEMEAAVLYTIAGIRRVEAATLLVVSDLILGEAPVRIGEESLRAAVDRMAGIALSVAAQA
jgi:DeoD family purine-nucleoside phosphorylase